MKSEERHKCVVIPITRAGNSTKFLTVRDKRFKEWTFITGGCRKREIPEPVKCAMRELDEETRGTFEIKEDIYKYFSFVTKRRSPEELERDRREGLDVTCVYHVYIFVMDYTEEKRIEVINNFEKQKEIMEERKRKKLPIKKSNDENDFISFDTFEEFMSKTIWRFIYDAVIVHPEFKKILLTFFSDDQKQSILHKTDTCTPWGRSGQPGTRNYRNEERA